MIFTTFFILLYSLPDEPYIQIQDFNWYTHCKEAFLLTNHPSKTYTSFSIWSDHWVKYLPFPLQKYYRNPLFKLNLYVQLSLLGLYVFLFLPLYSHWEQECLVKLLPEFLQVLVLIPTFLDSHSLNCVKDQGNEQMNEKMRQILSHNVPC